MAGTAGFALFHGRHADPLVLMFWLIKCRVALVTACGFHMQIVTEKGRSGLLDLIGNFLDRMAGNTLIKTKGLFIVMAGTAGLALFHLSHGKSFVEPGVVDRRVAGIAVGVLGKVVFMTESGGAGRLDRVNLVFCFMAAGAFIQ